jgi:putative oxidoreductase
MLYFGVTNYDEFIMVTERVISVKRLDKWAPTIIRLVLGLIFINHGWGKVQGMVSWLNGSGWGFVGNVSHIGFLVILPPVVWAILATLAEFVGGILVVVGYRVKPAALSLACVMLVAIFGVHLPAGESVEFQVALLAMAISLILSGPGRYSVKLKK